MYQALYRKYRPKTFDDVVGQNAITQTLKTQVATGRLSHAYLFTGTRGTGKTSCAKILAKAVNCLSPVDGNPCNHCAACRSIEEGSCMDVLEIDAASNNGVDHVRALRDDAIYTPAEVRRRVYIIDEVHMLSMSAFNALLKIIEEPPEHLLFILATTELQKVPATILSRCQRFSFRRLLPEDIDGRLNYVAYQEKIELEPDASRLLSRLADGALRDGLSLLDQCASAAAGPVTVQEVYDCLGLAGEQKTYELLKAAGTHDSKTALQIFAKLYQEGKDIGALLSELCEQTRDLLILKTAGEGGKNLLSGICTAQQNEQLLRMFTEGELLRLTELLQQTSSSLSRSTNLRIDGELCILKLCSPALQMDAASLNARLSVLERAVKNGTVVQAAAQEQPAAMEQEPDEEQPPFPDDDDDPSPPEEKPKADAPVGFWADLLAAVRPQLPPKVRGFFAQSGPVAPSLKGDTLYLVANSDFVKKMIEDAAVLQQVKEKADALLGRPVRVTAALQGAGGPEDHDVLDDLIARSSQFGDKIKIQ